MLYIHVNNIILLYKLFLWYHLFTVAICGTSKSMLENLFKSAKLLLKIVHRYGEDSIFSCTSKNLTPLRPSFQMSGILFSILSSTG